MDYNLGAALKTVRQSRNLTQKQLGEMVNIEESSISKIECGYSMPSLDTFRALVIALGTSADLLLGTEVSSTKTLEVMRQTELLQERLSNFQNFLKLL